MQPSDRAEVLARMVDYGESHLGPSMIAFTNELGGRVVVTGYYPWSQLHSLAKSSQMKAVCDWLCSGQLPVVSESFAKVVLWFRKGVRGPAVVLLNASLDPVPELSLRLRTEAALFLHTPMDGPPLEVSGQKIAAGSIRVVLHDLAPWSIHLLAVPEA